MNMKKIIKIFSLIALIASIGLVSCEEEGTGSKKNRLSNADKELIVSEYKVLNDNISEILLKDDCTKEDFEEIIPYIHEYSSVKKAWIDGDALFVKFKKGGIISWIIRSEMIIPPYIGELRSTTVSAQYGTSASYNKPSNNMACLINQQYGDDSRQYCKDYISNLSTIFERSGYDVTIKNGQDANLTFFEKELNQYGVIFCINHGGYDSENDVTWLMTGEEAKSLDKLTSDYYTQWVENEIAIKHVKESRGLSLGSKILIPYYSISDRLFASKYQPLSFPNSVIYWVACQSMKSPSNTLEKTLQNKGVGVTIGWDETNCLGQSTGFLLFQKLLGGENIQNAFQVLPSESKKDDCSIASGANLVFYPNSGGNMYLVSPKTASISIQSPINGQTYADRVITLSGTSNGFQRITNGQVEVNGIATTLTVTGNTTFSQLIELNSGQNYIKVSCDGISDSGEQASASSELTVVGDFPLIPLFTEMRWNTDNTDVDLHLVGPNGEDCYYNHMSTSWGGFLDIDNIRGYGPEHITIPELKMTGTYRLFVHYFAERGHGTSNVWVYVSTTSGEKQFGPYPLKNNKDSWEVCTIEFPSGTITTTNLRNSSSSDESIRQLFLNLPQKK
jgi:uncharacterized protein YfaP (DUF2135 family)